jgi:hypothetical protein
MSYGSIIAWAAERLNVVNGVRTTEGEWDNVVACKGPISRAASQAFLSVVSAHGQPLGKGMSAFRGRHIITLCLLLHIAIIPSPTGHWSVSKSTKTPLSVHS